MKVGAYDVSKAVSRSSGWLLSLVISNCILETTVPPSMSQTRDVSTRHLGGSNVVVAPTKLVNVQ